MTTDRVGMEVLDAAACRELLRTHALQVGRVAFAGADGVPVALPMNFRLDGEDVVLRTGDGQLLAVTRGGGPMAFEVDHLDPAWGDGWSVLVQGVAVEITEVDELDRVRRLRLRTWAPGHKSHWLRLPTERISGRRIM